MVTKIQFPDDLVEQNRDEFPDEIVDTALLILDVWDPSANGKAPSGVAATAVYVAADMASVSRTEYTQKEVCEIFSSSPMTIRKQQSDCFRTARQAGVLQ